MREVLRVMKETQCIFCTAIAESGADGRGARLESVANLRWDHHIGIARVANSDRHLAGNKFPFCPIVYEISCRGVDSSHSHSHSHRRLDAVDSAETSGSETEHK